MPKLIRITTVPMALKHLLAGQMKYMSQHGFTVIMVSADGKERQDVIKNEGCDHVIIPMTRKITPFADIKSLWLLYRFLKKEKPDIVHSHTPKAGLLAMLAAKFAGIKIRIHTIAGLRFMTSTGITRTVLIWMEKITAGAATHVWPNSFSLLSYISRNKLVKQSKMQVIGHGSTNGINLQRFSASSLKDEKLEEIKKLINYNDELIYLLCVGRVVKDKGIEELLKAFKNLYTENEKLRLVLLGSFEEDLDPLDDETRTILSTHPGIIHISWNDAVEYFMKIADMLVHPSYREGFPNVLLQAGAMNCPVLCSRIEGNIDIVTHDSTGLVFEVRNEMDLKDKLQYALNHPVKMKEYANNLRQKIEMQYDQKFVQETLRNKYVELLNERG